MIRTALQKLRDGVFHLPVLKNTSMKVPATVFFSDSLLEATDLQSQDMWQQLINACSFEGVEGVCLTPDAHMGYGVPIGCVIASKTHLYPTASGYDISCGMNLFKTSLHISSLASLDSRRKLIDEICSRVPTGMGHHRANKQRNFTLTEIDEILYYGSLPIESEKQRFYHEREHLDVDSSKVNFPDRVLDKRHQLGSLGGGNHFCELQVDSSGSVYVMLHTGSRGFGWNIANYFFKEGAKLQNCHRDLLAFPFDSQVGQHYWTMHNMAANFAIANRIVISQAVKDAFVKVFKDVTFEDIYEISHNLVQKEGDYFVHRKGATRAFTGEKMKPTSPWGETGHPIIIPGSMASGAAILFASTGAKESYYSINHGAGRLLGRNEAKKKLNQDEVNLWMANIVQTFDGVDVKSILVNDRNIPLDESGGCYKGLDDILNAVEVADLAKVRTRLYPIAVVKGND